MQHPVHLVWSSLFDFRQRSVHLSGLAESYEKVRTTTNVFAGSYPSRFDPKRGQREVAREFSDPDSEGTVFESSGWWLSSPLRGSFDNARSSMSVWTRVWKIPRTMSVSWERPTALSCCLPHSKAVSSTKPSSEEQIRRSDNVGCVPLCGALSGSRSAAPHTIVTPSEDFPTPQEALHAVPIDEPLHKN